MEYVKHMNPTPFDVLYCLEKNDPGDLQNFANEFGYDLIDDYVRTRTVWKGCKAQYEHLLDLFGEELLEELCEIT